MEMLVKSCIKDLDKMKESFSRKLSVAEPQEEGRHAVSKFRRAVSMKIAIENRKSCNITAHLEENKAACKSREVAETNWTCECIPTTTPLTHETYSLLHMGADKALINREQL